VSLRTWPQKAVKDTQQAGQPKAKAGLQHQVTVEHTNERSLTEGHKE